MGQKLINHAREIGAERRRAGMKKNPQDANPFTPGTDLYTAFNEGWIEEGRQMRIRRKRRLIELQKMFRRNECPACGEWKPPSLYLCLVCWPKLPARTRRVLEKRDRQAQDQLRLAAEKMSDNLRLDTDVTQRKEGAS